MPYLPEDDRLAVEETLLEDGIMWVPDNAGQLNFAISNFINGYLQKNGLRYNNVNEMIGALECCKLELYRLIAGPYEDVKLAENGEVYNAATPNKEY